MFHHVPLLSSIKEVVQIISLEVIKVPPWLNILECAIQCLQDPQLFAIHVLELLTLFPI